MSIKYDFVSLVCCQSPLSQSFNYTYREVFYVFVYMLLKLCHSLIDI